MPTLSFAFGSTSDPIHLAKSWSAVPVFATASSSRARSGPARASFPVASITCRKSGTRCAASREISHQILIGARIRPFVSSKKPGDRSSRPVMLSSRRGSGAKERMKSGNSASPTVCAPRGIDCHVPISSDSKIQIRKTFRRFPKSTRFPADRLFRGEDRTIEAHELVVQRARVANADPALHVPFDARLNRDIAFLREVHDGLHHPLGPARQDLVKLLPIDELLGKGRCESGEAAG